MLARPSRPFIALSKRFASTKVPRTSFQAVRHSKVISPANLKPAPPPAKPKVELPLNLPEEWSHGNRALKPGLLAAVREEYKEKIITKQPEPLWSRVILFIQLISVTCLLTYSVLFEEFGPDQHVYQGIRRKFDNWWAQNWYINSFQRMRLEQERAKQAERIREQERLFEERVARRKHAGAAKEAASNLETA